MTARLSLICAALLALALPSAAQAQDRTPCPSFSAGRALVERAAWLSAGAVHTCADAEASLRQALRKARLNTALTSEGGTEDTGTNGTFAFGAVDNGCRLVPGDGGVTIRWRCALLKWDEAAGQPVGSAAGGELSLRSARGRRCGRAHYSEGVADRFVMRGLPCSKRASLMRAAALGGAEASYIASGHALVRALGMWCVGRSGGGGLTHEYRCAATNGRAARFRVRGS